MKLLVLMLWAATASALEPQDLPRIEYNRDPYYVSEGYRLGQILDFYSYRFFPTSYEGTMMVGFGTGRQDFVDHLCVEGHTSIAENIRNPAKRKELIDEANAACFIFTNPWPFSTLNKRLLTDFEKMDNALNTPVLIHYVIPWISVEHLITKTKNFVEGIYPVNPQAKIAPSFALSGAGFPTSGWLNVKQGFVDGRIVKASLDNQIRKSFEVTIQEGNLGNNFRRMSVNDQKMFDYIVAAMLTGKLLHIGYVELLGFENSILQVARDYDTPYRITSVELRE